MVAQNPGEAAEDREGHQVNDLSQLATPQVTRTGEQDLCELYLGLRHIEPDTIFNSKTRFNEDPRPVVRSVQTPPGAGKVDLTVGVLVDEQGMPAIMQSANRAAHQISARQEAKTYLSLVGNEGLLKEMRKLAFGENSPLLSNPLNSGRLVSVQTTGGGGGLNTALKFVRRLLLDSASDNTRPLQAAVSNLSWPNHRGIALEEGFQVVEHRLWNPQTGQLDLPGMLQDIQSLPVNTTLMLQHCCHNPTGLAFGQAEWKLLIDTLRAKQLIDPRFQIVIDSPYQGFGRGLDQDAEPIRELARSGVSFLLAQSGSKMFGLYGERIGALTVVLPDADTEMLSSIRTQALENLKNIIRVKDSNCPRQGAEQARLMLTEMRAEWLAELNEHHHAIQRSRELLSQELERIAAPLNVELIRKGEGMFSALAMNRTQARRLEELGVYAPAITADPEWPGVRLVFPHVNSQNAAYIASALKEALLS